MKPDKETMTRISALKGWVDDGECELLYDIASQIDDHCIVEIGSYRGKSTMALALGSKAGYAVEVFAIDPQVMFESAAGTRFNGPRAKEEFFRNVVEFGVGDVVYVINLTSAQVARAWKLPIGFLFLDGDHERAVEDFRLWDPYIVEGGLLGVHDFETWEVPRLAYREALNAGYEEVERMGGLAILQKPNPRKKYIKNAKLPQWIPMVYKGPMNAPFSLRGQKSKREYYRLEKGKPISVRHEDAEFFEEQGFRQCKSESSGAVNGE